ncbi:MAG: cupin domain-containing protein [Beijerinckiaceae bacterium]
MNEQASEMHPRAAEKYLVDPYLNWVAGEGVPVVTAPAVDLATVETAPWARFGVDGAICHVEGRCDFLTVFVFDIPAGGAMKPLRHTFEEMIYVVDGRGETEVILSDGEIRRLAWAPGALFSVPINATCIHRAPGQSAVRLASFNDFRYLMGLYRNEAFLFDNPAKFAARQDRARAERWVADPSVEAVHASNEAAHANITLADGSIGAQLTELRPHESDLAHRQMQGRHLLCIEGDGFSLSFDAPDGTMSRTPWKRGVVMGQGGMSFHQNVAGAHKARVLAIELGSTASPIFRGRRAAYGDTKVYASGAARIARADESARMKAARGGA